MSCSTQLVRPYKLASGNVQIEASIGVALQLPYELQDPVHPVAEAIERKTS